MEETTAARREAEELAEATFHPMINSPLGSRHAPSTPGSESASGVEADMVDVTPAGFEKTVARMRAKREYEPKLCIDLRLCLHLSECWKMTGRKNNWRQKLD